MAVIQSDKRLVISVVSFVQLKEDIPQIETLGDSRKRLLSAPSKVIMPLRNEMRRARKHTAHGIPVHGRVEQTGRRSVDSCVDSS